MYEFVMETKPYKCSRFNKSDDTVESKVAKKTSHLSLLTEVILYRGSLFVFT